MGGWHGDRMCVWPHNLKRYETNDMKEPKLIDAVREVFREEACQISEETVVSSVKRSHPKIPTDKTRSVLVDLCSRGEIGRQRDAIGAWGYYGLHRARRFSFGGMRARRAKS